MMLGVIMWIVFSVLEGVREGLYFDSNPRLLRFNVHVLFSLQRLTVLVILALQYKWWLILILGNMLVFPFFHDGMYYLTRHLLNRDNYPKGFWDNPSKTSTAIMDFNLPSRIVLLLIGSFFIFVAAVSN